MVEIYNNLTAISFKRRPSFSETPYCLSVPVSGMNTLPIVRNQKIILYKLVFLSGKC